VLKDGQVVLERGYGSAQIEHRIPVTPATVFHVASVTKQFTAFSVTMLAQQGKLSLDDNVRTHIRELPDFGKPVTIKQLIHHTSGLRDQWELLAMAGWRLDDVITKDQILRMMTRQRELNFDPGSEHLYSNSGYTLLAEIVERVGGMPFPDWMQQNVFRPLGMTSTHMHVDHEHIVPGRAYSYWRGDDGVWHNSVLSYANAGATSLFTTAGDLARWLRNFETAQVGGPTLIARMRERAILTSGDTISYAFGIAHGEQRGHTTWSHSGGDAGFRSYVVHFPELRLGVVVLSNNAGFRPAQVARDIADVYLDALGAPAADRNGRANDNRQRDTPAATPAKLPPRRLAEFAGTYYSPELETVYRVAVVDGKLSAHHQRHPDITLTFAGGDAFTGDTWFFQRVAFTRTGGTVNGFRLTGGRVRSLRFVRLGEDVLAER
jgi:CubicO group peptidase (beta-lactamase class C family)